MRKGIRIKRGNNMDTNENKINGITEGEEDVDKEPIESADTEEAALNGDEETSAEEIKNEEAKDEGKGENAEEEANAAEEAAAPEEPRAVRAFRWEYVQQSYYDNQAAAANEKAARPSGSKGGLIYGFIMTLAFLLAFSLLVVSLSLDDFAAWFKPTGDEKLSVEEIVDKCMPSTYTIVTQKGDSASLGTGFVINDYGYIITNYHVVENAVDIAVLDSSSRTYSANLVGYDAKKDIALLHADFLKDIRPMILGDSDNVKLGETVVAIGCPRGDNYTLAVSQGIVSAKDRVMSSTNLAMIQTDAALNPGNSGGPLIDSHGNVIGIVTSKLLHDTDASGEKIPLEGMAFAIPINEAKAIIGEWMAEDLKKPMLGITVVAVKSGNSYFYDSYEGVLYGYQKIGNVEYKVNANGSTEPLTAEELGNPENRIFTAGATGIYVAKITKGLGADGVLKPGDIITKVGNVNVTTLNDTHKIFDEYSAGDVMDVEIFRDGRAQSVKVLLKTKEDMLKARND